MGLLLWLLLLTAPMPGHRAGSAPDPPRATPVQEVPSTPAPSDTTAVRLLFGGDCMFAGSYAADVGADLHRAFSAMPELREADLASLNLEGPVTTRGTKVPKPFNFRMAPAVLSLLSQAGIDHACIANNHVFDYGRQGLFDTISYLDSAGIAFSGAGRNETEAYRPARFTVKGLRVAFLAFYGGGEAPGASGSRAGVARRELPRIQRAIAALRDSVDYLAVILHWGTEKATVPDAGQQAFARRVIDAGADAVIGHHPHVLQGIEVYRRGIIVYSLGNFVFGGNSRATYDTGLFEIRLARGRGEGHRAGYRFIPVRVERWQARVASGHDADRILRTVRERSASLRNSMFTNNGLWKESP